MQNLTAAILTIKAIKTVLFFSTKNMLEKKAESGSFAGNKLLNTTLVEVFIYVVIFGICYTVFTKLIILALNTSHKILIILHNSHIFMSFFF